MMRMSILDRGSIGASGRTGVRSSAEAVATSPMSSSSRAASSASRPVSRPREMSVNSVPDRQQIARVTTPTPTSVIRVRIVIAAPRSRCPQHVTDTADGVDEAWLAGALQLRAEVAHVDVDDVARRLRRQAPHGRQQLRSGQNPPGMAQEVPEQFKLLRRELDLPVATAHRVRPDIHHQVVEAERAVAGWTGTAA